MTNLDGAGSVEQAQVSCSIVCTHLMNVYTVSVITTISNLSVLVTAGAYERQ